MKLVSVTVKNFRSITKAYKLQLGTMTVLLGRNNEGKSNILRAVVSALEGLRHPVGIFRLTSGRMVLSQIHRPHSVAYNWESDFPVDLQEQNPDGQSEITLEFELSTQELRQFKTRFGSNLNGNLPMKVSIGRTSFKISISKQGPGAKGLTQKAPQIAEFVRERLDFQYIPAVRTAQRAHEVVDEMLSAALSAVETDPKYKEAMKTIAEVQEPILVQLSQSIKGTLVLGLSP